MKINEKLSVLFFLDKVKVPGEKPIVTIRITIDGKRKEISLSKRISPDLWLQKAGKAKGSSQEAQLVNNAIDAVKVKLRKLYDALELQYERVSVDLLKKAYSGESLEVKPSGKFLMYAVDFVIKKFSDKVEKGHRSANTLKKWTITKDKIEAFLLFEFRTKDILLTDIRYGFAEDFLDFLMLEQNIQLNTAMKYLKNTKQILKAAVQRGWIPSNPIQEFRCSYVEPQREFLTMEEIVTIYNKQFVERLNEVRDVFLFCCFTGYAFQEVYDLKPENIVKGQDGGRWVSKDRQKTDNQEMVPLLPIAEEILGKYTDHPYCKVNGKLLPVNTNQRYNAYLKEIALICWINKKLTTHTARHTFATTVTLENDVPLETVGKMLGHRSIRTTQIYAKITQKKISNNMKALKAALFNEAGTLKNTRAIVIFVITTAITSL